MFNILAIESSCDETAMAIINQDKEIVSHIIYSQAKEFEKLGGVVPEMASRIHEQKVFEVYEAVLKEADMTIDDIDAIATTYGPGLVGSLLIGVNFANSLAYLYKKKLIPVNHMQGHIAAVYLEKDVKFPMLSLVVSGGHTDLVYIKDYNDFEVIGKTLDDAVGECYDKVARLIKVGYPGGPIIDKLSYIGDDNYILPFPKKDDSLDFSFSGLKSSCFNMVNQLKMKGIELNQADFAHSFQKQVVNILLTKLKMAASRYEYNTISVVGGVSANSLLQTEVKKEFKDAIFPKLSHCTDNAAMIAMQAYFQYCDEDFVDGYLNAKPTISVEDNWIN